MLVSVVHIVAIPPLYTLQCDHPTASSNHVTMQTYHNVVDCILLPLSTVRVTVLSHVECRKFIQAIAKDSIILKQGTWASDRNEPKKAINMIFKYVNIRYNL